MEKEGGGGAGAALVLYLLAAWFWDFWPFTGGHFRPIDYEHDYHVYAYYPDDREVYLDRVTGLDACGEVAYSWAKSKNLTSARWDYICCSIRKGSQCYSKHR